MYARVKDDIVKSIVSSALGSSARVIEHQMERYSKLNIGMIASHYVLRIKVQEASADGAASLTFFVKSAFDLISADSTETPIQDSDSFSEEVRFFKEILPELRVKNVFAPKCWLATEEMLVFEDLGAAGYSMQSDSAFLSEESARLALSALAELHASSLLAEERLGKPLNEIYQFRERHFSPDSKLSRSVGVSLRSAFQLSSHFGLPTAVLRMDRLTRMVVPDIKLNVVCHGDVWRNNLMFSSDSCILVDYQLLRYTSPGADLAMFLYLNCSPELRKSFESELIRHYYRCFHDRCGRSKFEDVWKAYEERKLLGAFYAVMFLPRVLLPTEVHQEMLADQAELEKYLFGDRFRVILRTMNEHPEYELVVRKIVREFSELASCPT